MKRILIFIVGLCMSVTAWSQVKVVYHLSEGVPQPSRAIGNIRNHLAAEPDTKIIAAAHGLGIGFLLDGATHQVDPSFTAAIGELAGRGMEFRVCHNTLVSRRIAKERVAMDAVIVPSGAAEVARLQAKEACVYLRPCSIELLS